MTSDPTFAALVHARLARRGRMRALPREFPDRRAQTTRGTDDGHSVARQSGMRGLTEADARRLTWSTLQLAALPVGPWFIPAVVSISRFLLDGDTAEFDLVDGCSGETLVHHLEPPGAIRHPPLSVNGAADPHCLTVRLTSNLDCARFLRVWRTRAPFGAADHLLLECLRPHLITAWNRCVDTSDRLAELEWSSALIVRLGIDARGTIDLGMAPSRRGSELVAGLLDDSRRDGADENDVHIAEDGSFSILTARNRNRPAPEMRGWLLSRPEDHGSDMFLCSFPAVTEPMPTRGLSQRPRFAHVEQVTRTWRLTPKQRLVVEELVTGKGNKEIAQTLSCAEVTVEFHLTAIRRKAGVANRAALISRFWIDAHASHGSRGKKR
jgi:DNA-binding CsgD family transcriptional regulator